MSDMNIDPVLICLFSSLCATLVAITGALMLRAVQATRPPARLRVTVGQDQRFVSPRTDFKLPVYTGIGTRFTNRGPPLLTPPLQATAPTDRFPT